MAKTARTARDKAKTIIEMNKEAQRVEHLLGAKACIIICFFEEGTEAGKNITVQDAGKFPMPPVQFYEVMQTSHKQGLLDQKPKSKIIRPN